mmetsp:Transcript_2452/g.6190  ORF Transcript_2452/g.6190 Transcript_2452/m.6190 type:complete len:540 (+) Transcript_2452:209-1828(+)
MGITLKHLLGPMPRYPSAACRSACRLCPVAPLLLLLLHVVQHLLQLNGVHLRVHLRRGLHARRGAHRRSLRLHAALLRVHLHHVALRRHGLHLDALRLLHAIVHVALLAHLLHVALRRHVLHAVLRLRLLLLLHAVVHVASRNLGGSGLPLVHRLHVAHGTMGRHVLHATHHGHGLHVVAAHAAHAHAAHAEVVHGHGIACLDGLHVGNRVLQGLIAEGGAKAGPLQPAVHSRVLDQLADGGCLAPAIGVHRGAVRLLDHLHNPPLLQVLGRQQDTVKATLLHDLVKLGRAQDRGQLDGLAQLLKLLREELVDHGVSNGNHHVPSRELGALLGVEGLAGQDTLLLHVVPHLDKAVAVGVRLGRDPLVLLLFLLVNKAVDRHLAAQGLHGHRAPDVSVNDDVLVNLNAQKMANHTPGILGQEISDGVADGSSRPRQSLGPLRTGQEKTGEHEPGCEEDARHPKNKPPANALRHGVVGLDVDAGGIVEGGSAIAAADDEKEGLEPPLGQRRSHSHADTAQIRCDEAHCPATVVVIKTSDIG